MSGARIEAVTAQADLVRICAVARAVFGTPVPHPVDLRASLLAGGFCALAREGEDDFGALWSLAGWDGEPFQHSHMLAVHERARRRGLGEALKRLHAQWCRERDIRRIRWTFDPLMSGNARFNLVRLGAVGDGWLKDCYGALSGKLDPVARAGAYVPSDRLQVTWYLDDAPALPAGERTFVPIPLTANLPGAFTPREAVLQLREQMAPRIARGAIVTGLARTAEHWSYRVVALAEDLV